jgi:hypothetical protein
MAGTVVADRLAVVRAGLSFAPTMVIKPGPTLYLVEHCMGWLIVNVLLPAFLPPVLLVLAKTTPVGKRMEPMEIVKDGQLCWFALTLSCATFYDLVQNDQSNERLSWGGYAMFGVVAIGLVCGVYAVVAALESTPLIAKPQAGDRNRARAWMGHYKVFVTSIVLSVFASVVSFVIHVNLPAPS